MAYENCVLKIVNGFFSLNFSPILGEQATEIKRALIENHSKTLKKLEVHNLYKVEVEKPLSKLNNLQLQNCDLESVNSVLRRCGDALQGLEMFQCFGEKLDEGI